MTQLYDSALAEDGLTSTQFAVLVEIARDPQNSPTLTELAERLVMDRSGLSHGLRPLQRDGLVTLNEGAKDRRQRRIVLTAKGRQAVRRAEVSWSKAEARAKAIIGKHTLTELRRVLMTIAHDDRLRTLSEEG
jgi:DNA-binding MarR family transcriptional regulator